MRRILRPQCVCCERTDAVWESERWPTVLLCLDCARALASYIVREIRVVHGNPILIELIRGLWDERKGWHRFWIKNPDLSFSECWVNEKAESRVGLENQLDIHP